MKRIAILNKARSVVNVIVARDDFQMQNNHADVTGLPVAKGWSLVDGEWQAAPIVGPQAPTPKTRYTVKEVQQLLNDDEIDSLVSSSDALVVSIINRLRTLASLDRDLAAAQVAQLVAALQNRSIITAEREAQILSEIGE
jgi:hypothetical protein